MYQLALRCLVEDRGRLVVALTGVSMSTLLMLVQLGIYFGFGRGATAPVQGIGGDVWVMARGTRHFDQGAVLAAGMDAALRSHPCVTHVRPVVVSWLPFRRASGVLDTLQLVGAEGDDTHLVPWAIERGLPSDLQAPMRVSLDALDTSILAPEEADHEGAPIGARMEIAEQEAFVRVMTRGLRSNFGLHPMVFASPRTARVLTHLGDGEASFWVADLRRPACTASVVRHVERNPLLMAMSTEAFIERNERELYESSGIGVALSLIASFGFCIALVVVAQTLLGSLRQHRKELGMLVALGAHRGELIRFVVMQVSFIAVTGSALGACAALLIRPAFASLSILVVLPIGPLLIGVSMMIAICGIASLSTVYAILRLSPDEVLR